MNHKQDTTGCAGMALRMQQALDRDEPSFPVEVEQHLASCPACGALWGALRETEAACAVLGSVLREADRESAPDVEARVMATLAREEATWSPANGTAASARSSGAGLNRRGKRGVWRYAAAAAGVVLLLAVANRHAPDDRVAMVTETRPVHQPVEPQGDTAGRESAAVKLELSVAALSDELAAIPNEWMMQTREGLLGFASELIAPAVSAARAVQPATEAPRPTPVA